MQIAIKRAYDKPSAADGHRILIDRIWPRGISKKDAAIDEWVKDLAPSSQLRKWFGHQPEKWPEFKKRYFKELDSNKEQAQAICRTVKKQHVTFVYGAREERFNNAVALKEYLEKKVC
ncbi:MAG: DUF488 domain-containing protein [Planctomycetaceae bacterium]|nr:DUF488 domain-containing protein [Planctomycetaceae bacterium]